MRDEVDKPDVIVAQMAGCQHGVVSTGQLAQAGINGSGITRRLHSGRLHRVHRGVYAVGHPSLSADGRRLAAVFAGGQGAVLSHRSAAMVWELLAAASDVEEITVPGTGGRIRRRPSLIVHRSRTLSPAVVTRRRGIPVTTPARTLLDLRRVLPRPLFERALRQAQILRLDVRELSEPDPTRSELERRFLNLCRRHAIPAPEVNVRVGEFEVDFLWRDARLIVETDGFQTHGTRSAFEADRARDARLKAIGFEVLRFTWRQLTQDGRGIAETVRAVRARRLRSNH
jgi:very-short-patch-repair endonuclease